MIGTSRSRAGFTLLEVVVGAAIIAVLTAALQMTLRSVRSSHDTLAVASDLERRGHRAMDRILDALRSAAPGTAAPTPAPPASTSNLTFQARARQPDGTLALGNLQRIWLDVGRGAIVWTTDEGEPEERSVTLCRGIPALLDGEVLDLDDDNGNGLEDEAGLCFTFEDGLLVVRFTLVRVNPEGPTSRAFEGRVALRNGT